MNLNQVMYLEQYVEGTYFLPAELQRVLHLIKSIDERSADLSDSLQDTTQQLLGLPPLHQQPGGPSEDYARLMKKMEAEQRQMTQFAEEKTHLAQQAYDLIEMHALDLERTMENFEADLRAGGVVDVDLGLESSIGYQEVYTPASLAQLETQLRQRTPPPDDVLGLPTPGVPITPLPLALTPAPTTISRPPSTIGIPGAGRSSAPAAAAPAAAPAATPAAAAAPAAPAATAAAAPAPSAVPVAATPVPVPAATPAPAAAAPTPAATPAVAAPAAAAHAAPAAATPAAAASAPAIKRTASSTSAPKTAPPANKKARTDDASTPAPPSASTPTPPAVAAPVMTPAPLAASAPPPAAPPAVAAPPPPPVLAPPPPLHTVVAPPPPIPSVSDKHDSKSSKKDKKAAAAAAAAAAAQVSAEEHTGSDYGDAEQAPPIGFLSAPPAHLKPNAPRIQVPGEMLSNAHITPALKGRHAELYWPDEESGASGWYLIEIQEVDVPHKKAKIIYYTGEMEELHLPDIVRDHHMSLLPK